jgi:hypothetical protein
MVETVRDEITHLAESIRALERQLEVALAKRRVELNYDVHEGVVWFEQVVIARHRLLKKRLLNYVMGARLTMILSAPAIYALIIPLLLLDLFVWVYQGGILPGVWNSSGAPQGLSGVRPGTACVSQCRGETQLRVLRLR